MPQKEDRTVLLARIEGTYGVDSIAPNLAGSPSPYATDAMLISGLSVDLQSSTLERNNYTPSLSKQNIGVGRQLIQVSFTHELKASGAFGVAPRLGTLLRACGMAETVIPNTAAAIIANPVGSPFNSAAAAAMTAGITKGAIVPTKNFDTYRIVVSTAGVQGTHKYLVVGGGFHEGDTTVMDSTYHAAWTDSAQGVITVGGSLFAPTYSLSGTWAVNDLIEIWVGGVRFYYQVVTGTTTSAAIATAIAALIAGQARFTGTAAAAGTITVALNAAAGQINSVAATPTVITLGASGAQVTLPAAGSALSVGDYWEVTLRRPGVRYDPVSDNFSSVTLYAYRDGTLYRIPGARGTFTITANAGEFPVVNFTFTGMYREPIDAVLPSANLAYEASKPYKVELAEAAIYGMQNVCAQAFSLDIANGVSAKDCMNAAEAYDEIQITERTPTAALNPESTKPSIYNPWTRMRREEETRLHVMGGRRGGVGNLWRVQADSAQWTGAGQAARNKTMAYDMQFRLSALSAAGDDELFIHFG